MARISHNPNSEPKVEDLFLIALQSRATATPTTVCPPLLRLRPAQGLLVLPRRRRRRRPHPGGPRGPLQGDPRLPHRPRVELPQLRRALHHAPDHHGRQDGHAQQAHAAEPVRVVLLDARRHRRRRADARSDAPRTHGPRPGQPGHLLGGAALARGLSLDGALRARGPRARAVPRRLLLRAGRRAPGCDTKTVDNALQRVKRKVGAHLDSRAVAA